MLRASLSLALALLPFAALGQSSKTEPSPASSLSPSVLFGRLSRSTVVIKTETTLGSGVVTGKEEVVTNQHVIGDAKEILVIHGNETWKAEVVSSNEDHDLALLKVVGLKRPSVRRRASTDLKIGEQVYALGAPQGLELTMSDGLVSSLRKQDDVFLIQTSAPISQGSSGGGLFDSRGRLIGITTFMLKNGQNLNFAHPTEWIGQLEKARGAVITASTSAATALVFSVLQRPEALGCKIAQRAMVGMFSSGAEIVESAEMSETWTFENFKTQVPIHSRGLRHGEHPMKLVLSDLDKNAQFIAFQPTNQPDREYRFFFGEDGSIGVVQVEATSVHGQPRILAFIGECEHFTKAQLAEVTKKAREAAKKSASQVAVSCEGGSGSACLDDARRHLRGDGVAKNENEALLLFRQACELREGQGCVEAAFLYRRVGMDARAREFLKKGCELGVTNACR